MTEAPPGLLERLTGGVALLGGAVLLAASLMLTLSVALRWSGSGSISGDFEMVEIATALAVFAFLPYCQARNGNIRVDSLTSRLPPRIRRAMDAGTDLLWATVAALIGWQGWKGGLEELSYGSTTMAAGIPLGPAILATAGLAFLLVVACCVTAILRLREAG